jgi:arginine N-succinyltransferase
MSFIVRSARPSDLDGLFDLSKQFTLLNLPADKKVLEKTIADSVSSFAGDKPSEESVYLFVIQDSENDFIVASSLIHGQCGTPASPNYSYEILKRDLFSNDLGIGFIHQVLRLKENDNGPTEIGGLLVDRAYRGRPEKLGKLMSYIRFCYIGMFPDSFTKECHVEFAPPLTEEGRSSFWEALGRRFTGLPYQEADALSQKNKEFIKSLFPPEDIYLTLLDSDARLSLGRVGEETMPAKHMLEKMGFQYINEVDPFDGGPHYRAKMSDIVPIREGGLYKVTSKKSGKFKNSGVIGYAIDNEFHGAMVNYQINDGTIEISKIIKNQLNIEDGIEAFLCPIG